MIANDYITLEDAEIINDLAYDKYITEASRLSKEYNKMQSDYQKQKAKTDKIIEDEDRKRGKYQQLAKNSLSLKMLGNTPYTSNRLSKMNEESYNRENKAKKELARKKYVSKTRGLNRDIAVGDQPNSLNIGRTVAKNIAKGNISRNSNLAKASIELGKDSKKKQTNVTVSNGSDMKNVSYTPTKPREKGSVMKLANSFKNADIANNEKKITTGKHSFTRMSISKEKELKEEYKRTDNSNYVDSNGVLTPKANHEITNKLTAWSDDWWNNGTDGNSRLYM